MKTISGNTVTAIASFVAKGAQKPAAMLGGNRAPILPFLNATPFLK